MIVCDKCGDCFHEECVEFDTKIPFYYCEDCCKQLDDQDPSQNIPLLKYVAGYTVK